MRQLAGTTTMYRRADAAPLADLLELLRKKRFIIGEGLQGGEQSIEGARQEAVEANGVPEQSRAAAAVFVATVFEK